MNYRGNKKFVAVIEFFDVDGNTNLVSQCYCNDYEKALLFLKNQAQLMRILKHNGAKADLVLAYVEGVQDKLKAEHYTYNELIK